MLKIITDINPISYHESDVSDAVEELQEEGFDVTRIEKISRCRFFGTNVTHIHYKPN